MYAEPFIKEMSCICLVVDSSNEESCLSINYWRTKIPTNIPVLLVCNKSDISSTHVSSHGLPSIETSAKKGHNTSSLLSTIRDTIVQDQRAKLKGNFTERAIMPKIDEENIEETPTKSRAETENIESDSDLEESVSIKYVFGFKPRSPMVKGGPIPCNSPKVKSKKSIDIAVRETQDIITENIGNISIEGMPN